MSVEKVGPICQMAKAMDCHEGNARGVTVARLKALNVLNSFRPRSQRSFLELARSHNQGEDTPG
jgi:hypothetical protein